MKKKSLIGILAAAGLLVLGVAGLKAGQFYYDRKVPNFRSVSELYVYPDTPVDSVVARICADCDVKHPGSVRRAFASVESVKAGHYTVDSSSPSVYVARMLSLGWQTPVRLVLSGAMRSDEAIARKISSQLLLDSLSVVSALRDSARLARYGFSPQTMFALFIPDTYEVYWTESMDEILARQKKAYDAYWTDENRLKAARQGLTPMEVSILASIVKGETNYEPEMPSIAGVYLNRLKKGMLLQADPTVAFCFDYEPNRILRKHTQVDSPYNTYKYAGLPPAPIQVPTRACLDAVLNPDRHAYLYFCASPDFNGRHRFAETYSEHLMNARAFQRALTARQRAAR